MIGTIIKCPFCNLEGTNYQFLNWNKDGKKGFLGEVSNDNFLILCPRCFHKFILNKNLAYTVKYKSLLIKKGIKITIPLLGLLLYFVCFPIYAYKSNLFGGAWVNAINNMAVILSIPAFLIFVIGLYLSVKKLSLVILFSITVIIIGFLWTGLSVFVIGFLLTPKGW